MVTDTMSFLASEEITAALQKGLKRGTCKGVVVRYGDDGAQIALQGYGLSLRQGDRLHLRSQTRPDKAAWARVDALTLAGDVKLVGVSDFHFENELVERAARFPIQVAAEAVPVSRPQQVANGKTINLSITGALIELPEQVATNENLQIRMVLGERKVVEAIARVARTMEAEGRYQIGLEFQRFIRGFDHLAELVFPI